MYKINQIDKTLKEKSWWAIIFNLKIAKYITYFLANYTNITPNQVTLISFVIAIISGYCFYNDKFIIGAILFQLSYIFDIVDGSLARLKNLTSSIGDFFDVFTDWIKAPLLIIILLFKTGNIYELIIILYLLFLICLANKYNDMLFYTTKKSISKELVNKESKTLISKYFIFMHKKNIQPLIGTIEFEGVVLFLYPLFRKNFLLWVAIAILIFIFLLKVYIIIKKVK